MDEQIRNTLITLNRQGSIISDGDVEELAQSFRLTCEEVLFIIAQDEFRNTPCNGCKYMGNLYGGSAKHYPCNICSRINQLEDHFQPFNNLDIEK